MSNLLTSLAKATADAVRTSIAEFDFNAEMRDLTTRMNEASERLTRAAKKLHKHIHNYFDKWVVDVNFNQEEDTITSSIKGNVLSITVRTEATEAETSFTTTIPEDVVISSLVQKYDPTAKKALFIFTKKDEVTE